MAIFLGLSFLRKAFADLCFLRKCGRQGPCVGVGVGARGGLGRRPGRLWGAAGPGQDHFARLLKPSPCYLSAPSQAPPCRGGTVLPALLHSFGAPLCAHRTCSPEPLATCSGQMGRSQHLHLQPMQGWWGHLPRARGPGPLAVLQMARHLCNPWTLERAAAGQALEGWHRLGVQV